MQTDCGLSARDPDTGAVGWTIGIEADGVAVEIIDGTGFVAGEQLTAIDVATGHAR